MALDGEPLLGRRTGIGNFCYWLIDGLTRLVETGEAAVDVGVYAVTWRMRPELESHLPAGARLLGRPMPARPIRAVWDRRLPLPLEWFTGRLDVVHGTNFIVPPTRSAARVVTVHDLTTLHYPDMCEAETLVFPDFVRRAVEGGAWVHTHSKFVADEVVDTFGADPARVRTIWPGIPPLESGPPGVSLDDFPFERYVLAVGTVEPRKDYPGLVRAFELTAKERPDVGLVIAGRTGWGAAEFEAAVESSPVRDRILQPGYVSDSDLSLLLSGAAALAYPSRYEGFGFPPLQAMSAGVPVVATATGSLPEILGDAAVMVKPGDVEELACALGKVLDDREGREALVEAGRARAALFSWDECARQMIELYMDAAGG